MSRPQNARRLFWKPGVSRKVTEGVMGIGKQASQESATAQGAAGFR